MSKFQAELEQVIGKGNQVNKSDISRLPYLQAIVKETFRLHPPAPLLVPRKAENNVEVCGCTIPKDCKVLVNVRAIGRDSDIWENPEKFMPERLLNSKIDVGGREFELIPFGAELRLRPGWPLATRMSHLMLGSLLHSFDWRLEDARCYEHGRKVWNNRTNGSTFANSLYSDRMLVLFPRETFCGIVGTSCIHCTTYGN